ncbi:hypothetical protein [Halosimplex amylolyticum]|uniref:hypothetical protein n=1 Tax=Halosimplex amylolyticum TaxID=3396616 RepID=UPI003F54EAFF
MTDENPSRRQFLRGGLALSTVGIAGCAKLGPIGSTGSSVITGTSISGSTLVVELEDDHEVSKVNLIDSSGSSFKSAQVTTGATKVSIELFDLSRDWSYQPGKHSIVAVADSEEVGSTTINLQPELEIKDIEQYTDGRPTPSNRANLLVTVENVGTGPTWVYHVGYENALHSPANRIPTNQYARTSPLLNLDKPESTEELVLDPEDSVTLLGTDSPLLLSEDDHCNNLQVEMSVIVSAGIGENARKEVQAILGGEPERANFRGTCSDIRLQYDGTVRSDG